MSFDSMKGGYRLSFRDADQRKRSIWLGGIAEANANDWKVHVEHLLDVATRYEPPHKATSAWLAKLSDKEHRKLATAGLVESRAERSRQRITLSDWCDTYIDERADVKATTKQTYEKARDCLVAYFTGSKPIREIQAEDAKRWRIWLATKGNRRDKNRSTMADATVRRRTGKAKQFFAEAMERGLIDSNPFAKLPSHVTANTKRQFFVPAEWIERCIEAAPDGTWRTILALARYGGLRVPSELLRLKWTDVNLPEGRMIIHASKTEHHGAGGVRVCPIFPELAKYLQEAQDAAPDGAVYVVDRYRGSAVNLRTRFEAIIKFAGLTPWPKLMQNLRASRQTELMAKFPAKDVASWLGNSVPVAMNHYAMATAESFRQAIETPAASFGGSSGGSKCDSIRRNAGDVSSLEEAQKNPAFPEKCGVLRATDRVQTRAGLVAVMGDTELESVTSTMST
jgi:integrase